MTAFRTKFLSLILMSIFCVTVLSTSSWADKEKSIQNYNSIPQKSAPVETIPQKKYQAPPEEYLDRINPGDQLRVYVFGVADLSGEFRVDNRGLLTLPLIGEINTQGMTKKELENFVTDKLVSGGYYNDPKVTIEISALQPFYILGEVKNPGSYEYTPDLDVFKAIATAGGYTPRAAKNKIIVIRKVDGDKVNIKATEGTPILPGDSIKVEQRFF